MKKFFIEMIDVGLGDSFIINMVDDSNKVRILVDGGKEKNNNIYENLKSTIENPSNSGDEEKINGIVVTHIDDDHIGGILNLLNDKDVTKYLDFSQKFFILFNDFVDPATISYVQGIRLKQIIDNFKNIELLNSYSRNYRMKINNIKILFRTVNRLIPIGGYEDSIIIDILLPYKNDLKLLMKKWKNNSRDGVLVNKTSIVFTVKFNDKTVLLTGDNYLSRVLRELEKIDELKKIDLVKISHHGSKKNNLDIVNVVNDYECKRLFSNKFRNEGYKKNFGKIPGVEIVLQDKFDI